MLDFFLSPQIYAVIPYNPMHPAPTTNKNAHDSSRAFEFIIETNLLIVFLDIIQRHAQFLAQLTIVGFHQVFEIIRGAFCNALGIGL